MHLSATLLPKPTPISAAASIMVLITYKSISPKALSLKLDPSKKLLHTFVDLNNRVLDRFTAHQRLRIGVHTCPGGDQDSTHSADVDYNELLPSLFDLKVGNFYVQLASEKDPERALRTIKEVLRPGQRVFVGVIDVL